MTKSLSFILLLPIASAAFAGVDESPVSPLSVVLGTVTKSAGDAVLDGKYVGTGERFEQIVSIHNNLDRAIDVDAFATGDGILAVWADAVTLPSTRARIAPATGQVLDIKGVAVPNLRHMPSIVFMEKWKELGRLDLLYHALPAPTLPPDGVYVFGPYLSGQGQDMSGVYRFCTPPPPVGYRIVSSTGTLSAHPGFERDPRGCFSWAECGGPTAGEAGEGVCYAAKVQGHYENNGPQYKVEFDFAIKVVLGPGDRGWNLRSAMELVGDTSGSAPAHNDK